MPRPLWLSVAGVFTITVTLLACGDDIASSGQPTGIGGSAGAATTMGGTSAGGNNTGGATDGGNGGSANGGQGGGPDFPTCADVAITPSPPTTGLNEVTFDYSGDPTALAVTATDVSATQAVALNVISTLPGDHRFGFNAARSVIEFTFDGDAFPSFSCRYSFFAATCDETHECSVAQAGSPLDEAKRCVWPSNSAPAPNSNFCASSDLSHVGGTCQDASTLDLLLPTSALSTERVDVLGSASNGLGTTYVASVRRVLNGNDPIRDVSITLDAVNPAGTVTATMELPIATQTAGFDGVGPTSALDARDTSAGLAVDPATGDVWLVASSSTGIALDGSANVDLGGRCGVARFSAALNHQSTGTAVGVVNGVHHQQCGVPVFDAVAPSNEGDVATPARINDVLFYEGDLYVAVSHQDDVYRGVASGVPNSKNVPGTTDGVAYKASPWIMAYDTQTDMVRVALALTDDPGSVPATGYGRGSRFTDLDLAPDNGTVTLAVIGERRHMDRVGVNDPNCFSAVNLTPAVGAVFSLNVAGGCTSDDVNLWPQEGLVFIARLSLPDNAIVKRRGITIRDTPDDDPTVAGLSGALVASATMLDATSTRVLLHDTNLNRCGNAGPSIAILFAPAPTDEVRVLALGTNPTDPRTLWVVGRARGQVSLRTGDGQQISNLLSVPQTSPFALALEIDTDDGNYAIRGVKQSVVYPQNTEDAQAGFVGAFWDPVNLVTTMIGQHGGPFVSGQGPLGSGISQRRAFISRLLP